MKHTEIDIVLNGEDMGFLLSGGTVRVKDDKMTIRIKFGQSTIKKDKPITVRG